MLGIFDSGLGGLTVVRAIEGVLPGAAFIYLGDTARLPYGTKSPDTISRYTNDALEFLSAHGATIPIIACHTASSRLVSDKKARKKAEAIFSGGPLYEIVTPAVLEARKETKTGKIGILGTSATIRSGAYENALDGFSVTAVAASVLVGLAEEGFGTVRHAEPIFAEILEPFRKNNVDVVVLACTHFPILADAIRAILGPNVELIDPGRALARRLVALKDTLESGPDTIYATDIPEDFAKRSSRFLGRTVQVRAA